MHKIHTSSIRDLGKIVRRKSVQTSKTKLHTCDDGNRKSMSLTCFPDSAHAGARDLHKNSVSALKKQQDLLTNNFANSLFLKTQLPIAKNVINDLDEFQENEVFDLNPILDPVTNNDVPLNTETHDINYVEENQNTNNFMALSYDKSADLSLKTQQIIAQKPTFLTNYSNGNVNQTRYASTYDHSSIKSSSDNNHNDQSQFKHQKNQLSSNYRKLAMSRSGRAKHSYAPEHQTSKKALHSSAETKKSNKNLNYGISRSEQKESEVPSLFSIQSSYYYPPLAPKRFICSQRNYTKHATNLSNLDSEDVHGHKYNASEVASSNYDTENMQNVQNQQRGFSYNPKKKEFVTSGGNLTFFVNKRFVREFSTEGQNCNKSNGTKCNKSNGKNSKTNGMDKKNSKDEANEEDNCSKRKKICTHFKDPKSCYDKLQNPCSGDKDTYPDIKCKEKKDPCKPRDE